MLFNCQTRTRIRKHYIDTLAIVQPIYMKQTLRVLYSKPSVVISLEVGLLPLSFIVIDVRRFVYLHHILLLTNDKPMKNLYYQQLDLAFQENWANKIHHLAKQYNIIVEEGYVMSLSHYLEKNGKHTLQI